MNNVGNFLHASDPVDFVRDRLHFDPDPWQQAILPASGVNRTAFTALAVPLRSSPAPPEVAARVD